MDEIPRGQRCDCQAADRRGTLAQLGPWGTLAQQGFEVRLDVDGWNAGPGLRTGTPSGPTMMFQVTSLQQTGDQVMNLGSVMSAVAQSLGAGRTGR